MDKILKWFVVGMIGYIIWTQFLSGEVPAVVTDYTPVLPTARVIIQQVNAVRVVATVQPTPVLPTAEPLYVEEQVPTTQVQGDIELYEGCGDEFYSCEDLTAIAVETSATTEAWLQATPVVSEEFAAELVAYCKNTAPEARSALMTPICKEAGL